MKQLRRGFSLMTALLLVGQFGLAAVALADDGTPTPTDAPQVTDSPSPTPDPTATPAPTDTPSPSPEATPTPTPTPTPSASPSPSPSPVAAVTGPSGTTGAPDVCHAKPPVWVYDTTVPVWVKADQSSFICDTKTHYWLSPKYYFNTQSGWYEILSPAAVAALPADSPFVTAPNVIHTVIGDITVGSADYQLAQALGLLNPTDGILSGSSVNGVSTGPGSTNQASVTNSGQTWIDLTNLVNVINVLQSTADSGDATASGNTQVGNAVTGAASVIASLINALSSAWSWSNGSLNYFIQNLFGDQTGDINLNPVSGTTGGGQIGGTASVGSSGPNSDNSATTTNTNSLDANVSNTTGITNDIDLAAQSGNATADGNTVAGNVTSGSATAQVNIINLINSLINSGNSFFGILNIFGNLNGDILFPDGFLDGAVANGTGAVAAPDTLTGPDSTNTATTTNTDTTNINNTNTDLINNNINTTAATGDASASGNTTSGDVTTGTASTVQSLFNLTNTSIFGDNAVLVMVNVMGHWIGKIMSVPGSNGTESALLTGNATVAPGGTTGPNSTNNATVDNTNTTNINQSSTNTITNNVNVNAQSGDATATGNTAVGDVTSGNASASSSVANVVNSVLNVKHWFGVLVINVFGTWTGDVGDNTSAGDLPSNSNGSGSGSGSGAPQMAAVVAVFHNTGAGFGSTASAVTQTAAVAADATAGTVLAAATEVPSTVTTLAQKGGANLILIGSALALLVAGGLFSLERKLRRS